MAKSRISTVIQVFDLSLTMPDVAEIPSAVKQGIFILEQGTIIVPTGYSISCALAEQHGAGVDDPVQLTRAVSVPAYPAPLELGIRSSASDSKSIQWLRFRRGGVT